MNRNDVYHAIYLCMLATLGALMIAYGASW
jgi:hypothetical protein